MVNKNKPKKKHIVRKIILITLGVLVLGAILFIVYRGLRLKYTKTYNGYSAYTGSVSETVSYTGNLQSDNMYVYSASSDGTVSKLYVAVGDSVKSGDKLMRLSNGETIKADADGKVNNLWVEKDDEVNAGDMLVQVADFTHMSVSFQVDEYAIKSIPIGTACTVSIASVNKTYQSTVDTIDYAVTVGRTVAYYTATVKIDVAEDDGVYPGMQAEIDFVQESATDVTVLPRDAVSFDDKNAAYVYMKNEETGEMEQVYIDIGEYNDNVVEVKSGVNAGDTVYVLYEVEDTVSGLLSMFSGLTGGGGGEMPGGGGQMPGGDFGGGMPGGDFGGGGMPNMGGGNSGNSSGGHSGGNWGGGNSGGGGGGMPGGR